MNDYILKVMLRVIVILARHWYALHADRLTSEEEREFLDDVQTLNEHYSRRMS